MVEVVVVIEIFTVVGGKNCLVLVGTCNLFFVSFFLLRGESLEFVIFPCRVGM